MAVELNNQNCENGRLTAICDISETVLDTDEKPTRPSLRKLKLTTKPLVMSSRAKPTTTTKAKKKSLDKKARTKNKLKQWKKYKGLFEAQIKKNTLRQNSKKQSKMPTVEKSVSNKAKQKTNSTAVADLKSKALQTPSSLNDNTWKIPPKKDARRQTRHKKNSKKLKKSAKEYQAFMNEMKTSLNLKLDRTMQNKHEIES